MKVNKVLLAVFAIAIVTTSAFLLETDKNSAGAYDVTGIDIGDFTFSLDTGVKEAMLTNYNANGNVIIIPDTITYNSDEYKVTVIGTAAFEQKSNLTSLTMGNNVILIKEKAFRECINLNNLNLKNVQTVEAQAFVHCTNLTHLTADNLVTIGNGAFAMLNVINNESYTGPIPYMAALELPKVQTIGVGAFGTINDGGSNYFLARNFGTVNFPVAENIGAYAFCQAGIDTHLNIPKAKVIGDYAFFMSSKPNADVKTVLGVPQPVSYAISIPAVQSIGNSAFTGRGIVGVGFPSATTYTIGSYAFAYTHLRSADLGWISSVGLAAFDDIKELQYFTVESSNTKYASLISNNISGKGEQGALYSLDGSGNPELLIKLPPGIRPLLFDYNGKFTVADGVKKVMTTAFKLCPEILVDLNAVTEVPVSGFANSDVLGVSAKNVEHIRTAAFSGCASLTSFEFLTTGNPLLIDENAFYGTALGSIYLPKKTTVGPQAFAALSTITALGIWGDITVETDSFAGINISSIQVTSDVSLPSSVIGAESLYNGWNASRSIGGSNKIGLISVNNTGDVDISKLTPNGEYHLQIMSFSDFSPASLGTLQFVELKSTVNPGYHRLTVKGGIYSSESHGLSQIMSFDGSTPTGKTCQSGDGVTWELIHEYYRINFYSFPTDTITVNGVRAGVDPDYTNASIENEDMSVACREYIDYAMYLSGRELKSLMWQSFVRYGLDGWYTADDPDHSLAVFLTNNKVTAGNNFGGGDLGIQESWIYRDPVTDEGTLNLYAVFSGKEYRIEAEARLTGGQQTSGSFGTNPSSVGGKVTLTLTPSIPDYTGFDTGDPTNKIDGYAYGDYPYNTSITLTAMPKPGYVFVGWAVIDIDESEVIFSAKNDRSYLNSASGTVTWSMNLPSAHLKFVAYFAQATSVVFDNNDGSANDTVKFVAGDRLTEANNAYDGHDYSGLLNTWLSGGSVPDLNSSGNGTPYYTGDPINAYDGGLEFDGWYNVATEYTQIPIIPNPLNLTARWSATITFYTDDGTNGPATLSGTGLTLVSSGIYTYKHNVGTFTAGSYNGLFNYGTNYAPTISGISFNGWYVLSGGTGFGNIMPIGAGSNGISPYPNVYPALKRLEPGKLVDGNISLIALYTADVEFYFNGGVDSTSAVNTAAPYKVTVPVSKTTLFNDALFSQVHGSMPALSGTAGNITKSDSKGGNMVFMGWFVTTDGTALPIISDTLYTAAKLIESNVKLIAGWGVKVSFDNGGQTIYKGASLWVPGADWFNILEGTLFDENYAGIPAITYGSPSGTPPIAWYDGNTQPYTWFNSATEYTYSVTLTPAFGSIFQFNMMGGTPSVAYVAFDSPTATFGDVLQKFIDSLYDTGTGTYTNPSKTGLHYKTGSYGLGPGMPDAMWYKGTGGSAPDYVNGTPTEWNLTDTIGTTTAYIRWLADVSFDRNVDSGDVDPGTTGIPATIYDVDENTPFTKLEPFPVLVYNADMDRTFKGWYNSNTKYADQDGHAVAGLKVTGDITLIAKWIVEVKFYYAGTVTNAHGGTLGSDVNGTYVISEVNAGNNLAAAPALSKTNFTAGNYLWYGDGAVVPVYLAGVLPSYAADCYDPVNDQVFKNRTVYVKWYAKVEFVSEPSASTGIFASSTKYLLEGSHLSDLKALDPTGTEDLNPYRGDILRADWMFIGWFDISAADPTDYEDLGEQYYRTGFDYGSFSYPANDVTSSSIAGNVTLCCEHVVQVDFEPGYSPSSPIDSKWLRADKPLPDSTSPRFTPMPTRLGVTFTGWYDLSTSPRTLYTLYRQDTPDNTVLVTHSMTLTAAWLVDVRFYDLTQYLSDGLIVNLSATIAQRDDGAGDIWFEMPEGTTIREFIGADPSQIGKTFVSWFVEQGTADGIYAIGDVLYGLSDRIVGDITLTAGYGFVLSFNTNGGTPSSIPDKMVIEGQSTFLPEAPAKGRLTFTGWNDGNTTYNAGVTVTPVANTTYTAKWQVVVKIYDGISMTAVLTMKWDEGSVPSLNCTTTTSADYDGNVISLEITFTDGTGPHTVTIEKFIDRFDFSNQSWISYYSVFNGWFDPFTGASVTATDLGNVSDSTALFAMWKERIRFYDGSNMLKTDYVDTGAYLAGEVPIAGGWSDLFSPTMPLNPDTYRIRDSEDFIAVKFITVSFDGNGGTPQQQIFSDIILGTMVGAIPATEPTRGGAYFAGWYAGNTKYSFTDKLYDNITLTAKWQSAPVERFTVFAVAYANTAISPQGMVKVMSGDTVSFDFYAAKGYSATLLIDGQKTANSSGTYTFSNIRSDHSIEVMADNAQPLVATAFLTIHIGGKGDVLYSIDGGTTFTSYTSPLPLFDGADYLLKAVPRGSSYFDHWSGDASGNNPQLSITSDKTADKSVTANFGSSSGFGIGSLAIANLICMIIAFVAGIITLTVAYKRNYEGTGTGKALRFGALFVALIAVVLFFLTEGFGGTYVPYDKWTIVMAILTLITLILALVSMRYDYLKD